MKTKKLLVILLLGVIGVFASCNDKDDVKAPVEKKLESFISKNGWFVKSKYQQKPYLDLNKDGEIDTKDIDLSERAIVDRDDRWIFKSDKTFTIDTFKEHYSDEEANSVYFQGKWEIVDGSLIVTIKIKDEQIIRTFMEIKTVNQDESGFTVIFDDEKNSVKHKVIQTFSKTLE